MERKKIVGVITGEFLVSKAGLRIPNCLWWSGISIRLSYDRCNYFSNFVQRIYFTK